ncbi:MAG: hypothetical protein AB7I19_11660 [Planctomycetota bacterium]
MDQRLPSLLLAAILAALLWFGLAGIGAAPPPLDASAGRVEPAQIAELVRRIEGIERRLDRPDLAATAGASPRPVEAPVTEAGDRRPAGVPSGEVAAIRAELAKLWRALESRGAVSGSGGLAPIDGSVSPAVIRAARADFAAIAVFFDQMERDHEAARQEILMADQAEILRRFGRPWRIDTSGPGRRSWYFRDEQDERGFSIEFLDGFVTDL